MSSSDSEFAQLVDPYRRELLAHCYRMLGSFHDAEDVLQETYLRAWRGYESFEGRSSFRTWLYRIATNACLNVLERSGRSRVVPSGLGAASTDGPGVLAGRADDVPWLEPLPDAAVRSDSEDPAAVAARRETTRLAFVAALQLLPARQRAALLLRDVLELSAAETADVLSLSVPAVNSALQRARTHLAGGADRPEEKSVNVDRRAVEQYVTAFETNDLQLLTGLLRRDVQLEMPPIPTWFSGFDDVVMFFAERVMTGRPRRLIPISVNGGPGVAAYSADADGRMNAHSIQVLELEEGRIRRIYAFLDHGLFAAFGLPDVLDTMVG